MITISYFSRKAHWPTIHGILLNTRLLELTETEKWLPYIQYLNLVDNLIWETLLQLVYHQHI